jgi:hypothetical protein
LARNRTIRFVSFFKSFVISLFTSTLIFGIYFPYNDDCISKGTEQTCLASPSKLLRGQSECLWEADYDRGYISCSLRPPPSDIRFTLMIAVITSVISLPLDLLLTLLLLLVCNRSPNWAALGFLDSATESKESRQERAIADRMSDQSSIAYVLTTLRLHKRKLDEGPQPSTLQKGAVERIMKRLGLHYRDDPNAIYLNLYSRLFYSNISEAVEFHVKAARIQGSRLITEISHVANTVNDSSHLIETMLMHSFTYEYLGFFSTKLLQPHLDQYTRKIPMLIHPFIWIPAWIFVISVCCFFIVWVLLWGINNTGLTLQHWVVNFVLETIWGCFVSSTLRVFMLNVFLISIIRPMVVNTVDSVCQVAMDIDSNNLHEGTFLSQTISAVSYAARILRKNNSNLRIASIINKLNDEDVESIKLRLKNNTNSLVDATKSENHVDAKGGRPTLRKQDSLISSGPNSDLV